MGKWIPHLTVSLIPFAILIAILVRMYGNNLPFINRVGAQ